MTKQELVARMQEGQAWIPGKRVKLDFGEQGVILLDGAANQVSEEDGAADTTIKVTWDDWQAMAAGQLDGMTAFMTGKLKIEGDMSNAMQLQGVLSKLRSRLSRS
jgi:putative sterol carrier protein